MTLRTANRNRERATAAVEFAIILIPLILILFGIIEFSVLLYDKQVITNASREGARAGIVSQSPRVTPTVIQTVVNQYCATYLINFGAATAPTSTVTGYSANAAFGSNLTVQVNYQYTFLVLPSYLIVADPLILTAHTVMRYE